MRLQEITLFAGLIWLHAGLALAAPPPPPSTSVPWRDPGLPVVHYPALLGVEIKPFAPGLSLIGPVDADVQDAIAGAAGDFCNVDELDARAAMLKAERLFWPTFVDPNVAGKPNPDHTSALSTIRTNYPKHDQDDSILWIGSNKYEAADVKGATSVYYCTFTQRNGSFEIVENSLRRVYGDRLKDRANTGDSKATWTLARPAVQRWPVGALGKISLTRAPLGGMMTLDVSVTVRN